MLAVSAVTCCCSDRVFVAPLVQDRKKMVKTLKTNFVELCEHEQGHLVVLRAFQCVDDTVRHECFCGSASVASPVHFRVCFCGFGLAGADGFLA